MSTATGCWSSTWFNEQRSPWHMFSPQQLAPTPTIPWLVADTRVGQEPFPMSCLDWATLFRMLRQNLDLDVAVNRTRLCSVTDLQAQSPRFEICARKTDSRSYVGKWTKELLGLSFTVLMCSPVFQSIPVPPARFQRPFSLSQADLNSPPWRWFSSKLKKNIRRKML